MTSEAAPLPARPFTHLSVLSYLAIGIVVFASSLVTGYLIHSCYRSANRKDATRRDALEKSVDVESGTAYRRATGRRDWSGLELKPLEREFCYDEESCLSDNRVCFPKGYLIPQHLMPSTLQIFIGKGSDSSFDKEIFTSPPPHLVYSSDSTMVGSFRMHSPSSPSPFEKQIRQYDGQISYSPVSRSPSFIPDRSPPSILISYDERHRYAEPQPSRINVKTKRLGPRPGAQFDSNNIRYIPPLVPSVTESTVKLYKEPKLSPVLGSIVPPSPGDIPMCPSHGRKPSFSQHIGARSSTNSTPISVPQKRIRVISGETSPATILPRLPESFHNLNPISSQRIGQYSWEPTPPIVHLKPGPGYF
jgi:hypothetical protein